MPYIFKKYYPGRNLVFLFGEGILIFLSVLSVSLLSSTLENCLSALHLYSLRALLVTFIFQLSLYYLGLYNLKEGVSLTETTSRVLQAFGTGCIALAGLYYIIPMSIIPVRIFFPAFFAVCCSIFSWRYAYDKILSKKLFTNAILLLGSDSLAESIFSSIENKRDSGFHIRCIVAKSPPSFKEKCPITFEQETTNLVPICSKYNIDKIVVAFDERRGSTPVNSLLQCKMQGIPIENGITFYEKLSGKILVEKTNPDWFIYSSGFRKGRILFTFKRLIDLTIATIGLALSSPISLLSCLIIKLESPGPIIYCQERVGQNGDTFRILKFRSMRNDAEKGAPIWAKENDPRVTRYGGFIRKVRIDEIPQLWNILKGEMSFVGPRPERPLFVDQLSETIPYYQLRHTVKPGLTGWAQICYPYGASEKDALHKLEYDLYYIKYLSLQIDIWVIFQTIKTIVLREGSR